MSKLLRGQNVRQINKGPFRKDITLGSAPLGAGAGLQLGLDCSWKQEQGVE